MEQYPDKSLSDIAVILHQDGYSFHDIKIKVQCSVCGKEIGVRPSVYRKQKSFRCDDHIKHRASGKESKFYKRVHVQCDYCGKDMEIIPYDYENVRTVSGVQHHFCGRECYYKYRSKHYVRDSAPMFHRNHSPESVEKMRVACAQRAQKQDRLNTSPQLKIDCVLDSIGVSYQREYPLDYYSIDNFLDGYNLAIEVMGDYWHANPLKYGPCGSTLNDIQCKQILKDKQKHGYVLGHYGIQVLYVWEDDINERSDVIERLITKYIESGGRLQNYHSFNYDIACNGEIVLKPNTVMAFQDQPSNAYKKYLTTN